MNRLLTGFDRQTQTGAENAVNTFSFLNPDLDNIVDCVILGHDLWHFIAV